MPLFQTLKATTGTSGDPIYYFKGRSDDYPTAIATELGVAPAPSNEQSKVTYRVEDLTAKGALIRVVVSYGTGAGSKEARLLCLRSKLGTALDELIGKEFKGQLITSARIPRKAVFS